jgi:anti-anti-sigma factor
MDVFPSGRHENRQLITICGEIDLVTARGLLLRLRLLVGPAPGGIALDLSRVTFMDCAGLRTLIAFEHHVRTVGGSVHVASVSPQVARLFELVGQRRKPPYPLAWPARAASRRAVTPGRWPRARPTAGVR